jgi:hypothetical protein
VMTILPGSRPIILSSTKSIEGADRTTPAGAEHNRGRRRSSAIGPDGRPPPRIATDA